MPQKAPATLTKSRGADEPCLTASNDLSIILVDGARIRQKIKREYEKVRRDLETAQAELDRFQQRDIPAYGRWVNRRFGPLLTELRETTRRVHELEHLFLEIQTEMLFNGVSEAQAYTRVMERRNDPEPPPEDDPDEERSSSRADRNNGKHRTRPDQSFEDAGPEFDDFFDGKLEPSGKSAKASARLKELYRALARRLHPDAQKEMTPQKREWWHEAQAAYEAGDVEQLEQILSLCELSDTGTAGKATLSMLQRLSAQLKKSLRQLKRQLTVSRREPAWNFTDRTDIHELDAAMRRQLNHDLRLMQAQLKSMELEIAALAERSQRRRAPRPRRRSNSDLLDLFF